MGALNVNLETVQSLVDAYNKVTGEAVQNGMQDLAKLVADNEGNDIMAQFTENCKEMQRTYNDDLVPKFGTMLDELQKFEEFQAVVAKRAQSLTETKKVDTEMNVAQIEVPQL